MTRSFLLHPFSFSKGIVQRFFVLWVIFLPRIVLSQVENVPTNNQVYEFLKRMEVKGVISGYPDAVLPLSRREVAEFLKIINQNRSKITTTEQNLLDDFKVEFAHELGLGNENRFVFFSGHGDVSEKISGSGSGKEKFLYAWQDSSNTFFVDLLLSSDVRVASGDSRNRSAASTFVFGPRFRGTLKNKLGYYFQVTNGQIIGNREVALLDTALHASQELRVSSTTRSFNFVEGYFKVDADILTLQIGRERLLWGYGVNDKLIVSNNAPFLDYAKIDVRVGSFRYMFFHSWVLGTARIDTNVYSGIPEAIINSKFLVAHRFELSFPRVLDFGLSELIVYSRRFPELAYLNPVNLFKDVEPQQHDRDNSLISTDLKLHAITNAELYGTLLIDDITLSKLGSKYFGNQFAFTVGASYIEPLGIENADLALEYTRIDAYVYSHNIPENNYTNDQFVIGHHLGPNSDDWFFRGSYRFSKKWKASFELERSRHGDNFMDANGNLLKNVGGSALYGHRAFDSPDAPFLDGILIKTYFFRLKSLYEIFNELFLDIRYEYRLQKNVTSSKSFTDHFFFLQLRFDL